ncbi:MAG: hypothetical protein SOW20_03220 [Berryella intestinalis]|uniref:hypothetical protein n=1 Tax=Berryella intestinalis TaxID=1531429 RepID=UPI002A5283F4|nr:hypothetical protein [Berryella intestinalis]MDD7368778.1 hypothetical protein [Berryella intestinalis]MDY3129022.1 hypothetical protein [Berryella intestinalis]
MRVSAIENFSPRYDADRLVALALCAASGSDAGWARALRAYGAQQGHLPQIVADSVTETSPTCRIVTSGSHKVTVVSRREAPAQSVFVPQAARELEARLADGQTQCLHLSDNGDYLGFVAFSRDGANGAGEGSAASPAGIPWAAVAAFACTCALVAFAAASIALR